MGNRRARKRGTLRLGTRVTICIALVQIPILALAAVLRVREVRRDYLNTVDWRSQALAQQLQKRAADLSGYTPELQRTLGLNIDCQDLLHDNRDSGLVHVGILGVDGLIIAHTTAFQPGQTEHADLIPRLLTGSDTLTALGSTAYNTLIPVTVAPGETPIAVIDIGFSREVIDQKIRNTISYAAASFLAYLVLSFLFISGLLNHFVTRPITELSRAAAALARGEQDTEIPVGGSDEVRLLAGSFEQMRKAVQQQISNLNREIANRKETERQLSESEEDLRITLNSIGDGVIATDTSGNVTRINRVAESLTGWSREEARGNPLIDAFNIVNSQTLDQAVNPVDRVLATGEIVGLANHTMLIAKDGTKYQIADSGAPIRDADGAITGVVLVFRDVTDEYRMREALGESEARFRGLVESSSDWIWEVDAEGVYSYVSPKIEEMLGYKPVNVIGRTPFDLMPPDEAERVKSVYGEIFQQGKPFAALENVNLHLDGREIILETSGVPVFDSKGRVKGYRGVDRDITERKIAERAMRSQMETQKLLLNELDHRVRNNLSSLLSLIDLSSSGAKSVKELAGAIRSRTNAIASIHALLSDAQWRSGDLRKLLKAIIQPAKRTRIQTDGASVQIPLSQTQALGLIINEITMNSIKYGAMSVDDSCVQISWETTDPSENGDTQLTLNWRESGGPTIEKEPEPGTGTNLITGLVRSELRGRAEFSYPREGAAHTLHITLAADATAQFDRPSRHEEVSGKTV